jgi:hypothetical protein
MAKWEKSAVEAEAGPATTEAATKMEEAEAGAPVDAEEILALVGREVEQASHCSSSIRS